MIAAIGTVGRNHEGIGIVGIEDALRQGTPEICNTTRVARSPAEPSPDDSRNVGQNVLAPIRVRQQLQEPRKFYSELQFRSFRALYQMT